LIPSIRFEFIGGSEMVPLGAQMPPKPLTRKVITNAEKMSTVRKFEGRVVLEMP